MDYIGVFNQRRERKEFYRNDYNQSLDIHAIRPGLSGTVPDFDTLSWRPGNYEIVPEI